MDNDNSVKHILLIEDDPDLADLIGEYLGMNYYEVHHTPTATEGLDFLSNPAKTVDLVILDLMLPDMDGMQVCQKIRQNKDSRLAHTPIIMLTAKGDTTDRVLGLEMGADATSMNQTTPGGFNAANIPGVGNGELDSILNGGVPAAAPTNPASNMSLDDVLTGIM